MEERDNSTTKAVTDVTRNDVGSLVFNDEAWLQHHPKESVLLFQGAEVTNSHAINSQQKEVVHCDSCHQLVEGSIYCCKLCFDYDLCSTCYPTVKLTHADGSQEFRVEGAANKEWTWELNNMNNKSAWRNSIRLYSNSLYPTHHSGQPKIPWSLECLRQIIHDMILLDSRQKLPSFHPRFWQIRN